MKLIIEIDNEAYKGLVNEGHIFVKHIFDAVKNGIPIPDNATNGDVLNKSFPNLTYGTNGEHYHVWSNDGKCTMNIHQDFWNAPYQKGGKVE